ncbi:hypothetical protein TIFTF001_055791, partial [Ficus carica]
LLAWSKPLRVAGDAHRRDRLDHHSQVLVLFAGKLTLVWVCDRPDHRRLWAF